MSGGTAEDGGMTRLSLIETYNPDAAEGLLTEGLEPAPSRYRATFPHLLDTLLDGFDTPPG